MSDSQPVDETAAMADRRLTPSTKKTYRSAQKALKRFIKVHPDYKTLYYDAEHDKLRLPLPDAAVVTFIGSSLRKKSGTYKTSSTVGTMRSAIQAMYIDAGVVFNNTALLQQEVGRVVKGHKRVVAGLKETGEMKQDEGKRFLKMKGYRMLCRLALEQGETEVYLYLVSQWNLMVRTVNVKKMNYKFFALDGDASTIKTPYHKGDQEGKNAFPKHVYANPVDALICPFFAMGIHIVCNAFQRGGNTCVFQVECMESTFSNWIRKVAGSFTPEDLLELGMEAEDVGTHSIRKGAGTFCSSQPSGPNPQTVRLRMDHCIGNTESRYIFEGEGTDQMLGRTVAGLDFNSIEFASLPCHFENTAVLTQSEWALAVPGYNHYPLGFQECIPFYIAALAANHELATKHLPQSHRLFNSPFWTNGFHLKLQPLVLRGVGKCDKTGMRATGLPPHHLVSLEVGEIRREAVEFQSSVRTRLDNMMEILPRTIADEVRSKVEINGAVAVTSDDVRKMLGEFKDNILERLDQHRGGTTPPAPSVPSVPLQPFKTFYWGGQLHYCERGFRLPRDSVKACFNLWYCGNPVRQVAPYKHFKGCCMSTAADKSALPKLAVVMRKLETIAVEKEFVASWPNVEAMEPEARDELFRKCFEELYKGSRSKRVGELSFMTVYNYIRAMENSK